MYPRCPRTTTLTILTFGLASLASLSLTGCTLENSAASPDSTMAAVSGKAMGGESPIIGANVILWETDPTNSGYPSATVEKAVQLATTTTNSAGAFSFKTGYTCNPSQYVYITATGGNTSGNPNNVVTNNNLVEIAALGSCSNFATATAQAEVNIYVDEVTTVAAAYALGNFMYIDETNAATGGELVYIGAPANNNATTGSCSGAGASMTCTAAGLGHAFANAYNLADAVGYSGALPTGKARAATPGNSLSLVPQAEINTLANIMQYCTNSPGGAAPSGVSDGTNCGNFFALTTANSITPVDTLSALLAVAKYPSHNVGATCTGTPATSGGLFCLTNAIGAAFTPSLTAAPHEWTLAIFYPGATFSGTSFTFGQAQAVALDANDNVYVPALTSATNGSLSAIASNGAGVWTTGSSTTYCGGYNVATDTVGNVWYPNYTSSSVCTASVAGLYGFPQASTGSSVTATNVLNNASTANVQSAPWALGVDRFNNLWYGRKNSGCATGAGTGANVSSMCAAEIPYSSGAATGGTYAAATNLQTFAASSPALYNDTSIIVDANQNVWVAAYEAGSGPSTPLAVIPNTGTAAAPTYTATAVIPANTAEAFGMIAIDSSGNAWTAVASSLFSYSLTNSTTISGPNNATSTSNAWTAGLNETKGQGNSEFDSTGRLFFPSETSSGQIWYFNPTSAATQTTNTYLTYTNLVPCLLTSGSTTCGIGTGYPHNLQIDSTGSVWTAGPGTSFASVGSSTTAYLVQIIGVAGPVWPQLSYAKFGVAPQ